MRRRLITMSLAVTSIVVLAFVIPLGLLVRDLAHDRAMSAAERDAEAIARFLAVVGPTQGIEAALGAVGGEDASEYELSVVLPDGSSIGEELADDEVVDPAGVAAVRVTLDSGEAVHVPVALGDGTTVTVRVFVSNEELASGVAASWLTLGVLGLVLIGIAVFVSDSMARSVVNPVMDLSKTAAELGTGNVDARVDPGGPMEIHEVGVEFNRLAEQVTVLLQNERETSADLSHRLRTPVMAVRLDAEALPESELKERLLLDIDDLVRRVDFVIRESRKDVGAESRGGCDLKLVVEDRVRFWSALADEQSRSVVSRLEGGGPVAVWLDRERATAMVDALIGNVFAHTEDGVGFEVRFRVTDAGSVLEVEDAGQGFSDAAVLLRGESRGSGTGLGLDIARSTAETAGGTLSIGRGQSLGGASVRIVVPVVAEVDLPLAGLAPPRMSD